jgi:hypothetical protein
LINTSSIHQRHGARELTGELRGILSIWHNTIETPIDGFGDFTVNDAIVQLGFETARRLSTTIKRRVRERKSHGGNAEIYSRSVSGRINEQGARRQEKGYSNYPTLKTSGERIRER